LPLFFALVGHQNYQATSQPPSLRNGRRLFPDAYAAGLGILEEKGAKFNPRLVLSQKVPSEEEQNVALSLGSRGCGVIAGPADATQKAAIGVVEVIHVTGAPLLHFQRRSRSGLEEFPEIGILRGTRRAELHPLPVLRAEEQHRGSDRAHRRHSRRKTHGIDNTRSTAVHGVEPYHRLHRSFRSRQKRELPAQRMPYQRHPREIKANPIPLGFRGKGVQNEEQIGNQNAVVGVKQL